MLRGKQAKVDRLRAAIPRGTDFVCDQLACYQHLHAGGLDVVDMHKNIGAAVIGRDKAISAICVEEFDPATWHAQFDPISTHSPPTPPSVRRAGASHNAQPQRGASWGMGQIFLSL